MIQAFAILLLLATAGTWVRLAMPQVAAAWLGFARDLDPTQAPQHAVLFGSSLPRS